MANYASTSSRMFPRMVTFAIIVAVSIFLYVSVFNQAISSTPKVNPFKVTSNTTAIQKTQMNADLRNALTEEREAYFLEKHKNYRSQNPFPHTVIDDLFPIDIVRQAAQEIPDHPETDGKGCAVGSNACFMKDSTQKRKNAYVNDLYYGPATFALFSFMKSSTFISFLEKLTGINDIIPDPHYRGSGVHQTLPGGHLQVHADFNRYERYGLHRRVNVFIYLNDNWEDSYGGHLELWSKDMDTCGGKIRPSMGRFVVFSSTDFSYHGHPNPLTCPEDRSRRSIALYYYTQSRPVEDCINKDCFSKHTTLFQTTKKDCDATPT